MMLFVDDIVPKFPIKTIPNIEGEPNYDAICQMVQALYDNAASLATPLGGGMHAHIGLLIMTAHGDAVPTRHPVLC
jgi:hypothetical protein